VLKNDHVNASPCRYVIDTPRCVQPQTFMSNMLQACSILYKNKLPLLLVSCCALSVKQLHTF
jgi:hypothetical protein